MLAFSASLLRDSSRNRSYASAASSAVMNDPSQICFPCKMARANHGLRASGFLLNPTPRNPLLDQVLSLFRAFKETDTYRRFDALLSWGSPLIWSITTGRSGLCKKAAATRTWIDSCRYLPSQNRHTDRYLPRRAGRIGIDGLKRFRGPVSILGTVRTAPRLLISYRSSTASTGFQISPIAQVLHARCVKVNLGV